MPESPALRVATLNVWGHPDWIGRHGEARMRAIVAEIPALRPDVFALQEVWTLELRRILVEGARKHGLIEHWTNEATLGGSGLLLLSRHPLKNLRFHPYTLGGMPEHVHHGDYYSGKGYVLATVATPAGDVTLLNTHLQAGYSLDERDEHRGQRIGQVVEVARGLQDVRNPVVALGDFNIRDDRPEYPVLVGLSGLRDLAAELDHRQDTVLGDHPYRGAGHVGGERIDYVLCRDGENVAVRGLSVKRVFDRWLDFDGEQGAPSDHAGLLAEIAISPRARATRPAPSLPAIQSAAELLALGRAGAESRQRVRRALGVTGGLLALGAGAQALRSSRRTFLRAALFATALSGAALGGVCGFLSERALPTELAGYDRIDSILAALGPSES